MTTTETASPNTIISGLPSFVLQLQLLRVLGTPIDNGRRLSRTWRITVSHELDVINRLSFDHYVSSFQCRTTLLAIFFSRFSTNVIGNTTHTKISFLRHTEYRYRYIPYKQIRQLIMASSGFGMRPGIILLREGTDTSQVCVEKECKRKKQGEKKTRTRTSHHAPFLVPSSHNATCSIQLPFNYTNRVHRR